MITPSCTSSVEAVEADIKSSSIILGVLDRYFVDLGWSKTLLCSQSTGYSPLGTLTVLGLEVGALEDIVSPSPTGDTGIM